MVRWCKLVIIFSAATLFLSGCNSSTQNFLGVENDIASNQDSLEYSIQSNQGVFVYKDNGVYNSTGIDDGFSQGAFGDIDFDIDYPADPIAF